MVGYITEMPFVRSRKSKTLGKPIKSWLIILILEFKKNIKVGQNFVLFFLKF